MAITVRHSGDPILDQFQAEVAREFDALARRTVSPLNSAMVLDDLVVDSAVPTTFDHRLGRVHQGALVIKQLANATVWEVGERVTGKLTLQASAAVTVSVLVF
jgi:hypothetical protein